MTGFRPAPFLRAHSATLWGRLVRREPAARVRVERWDTPDGDFVEVARLAPAGDPERSPRLLLLHGLEGGLHSHYTRGLFREAAARGWGMDLLLFRTCGPTPNRLVRSYHSGETSDPRFVVERLATESPAPLGLVGVSLGGNVLCRLLGEASVSRSGTDGGAQGAGGTLPNVVRAAVGVSVPFDLARASRHIGRGFGVVYEQAFLRTLRPKALAKIARHPELAHLADGVRGARTLWAFDDAFTAPVHGFDDAADYYARASALPVVGAIETPTLLLSAADDPFLPPSVLDVVREVVAHRPTIECEFTARGGHVGFVAESLLRPHYYAERRAIDFLAPHLLV